MPERNAPLAAGAPGLNGRPPVFGVIFAGGASRRYGADKALAPLGGVPLLQRVIDRVQAQVDVLALGGEARPDFSLPHIADAAANSGPLSALLSALAWAEARGLPLVASFSCDTPFLPPDLVGRLRAGLAEHSGCAVVRRAGALHPICALWRSGSRGAVEAAFAAGIRSLHQTLAQVRATMVEFPLQGEGPGGDPFFNINSPADMVLAQSWLDERRGRE